MDNNHQLTITHRWINYLSMDNISIDIIEFEQFYYYIDNVKSLLMPISIDILFICIYHDGTFWHINHFTFILK